MIDLEKTIDILHAELVRSYELMAELDGAQAAAYSVIAVAISEELQRLRALMAAYTKDEG